MKPKLPGPKLVCQTSTGSNHDCPVPFWSFYFAQTSKIKTLFWPKIARTASKHTKSCLSTCKTWFWYSKPYFGPFRAQYLKDPTSCWSEVPCLLSSMGHLSIFGYDLTILFVIQGDFRDKMQQRSLGSWVKALWWISVETAGSPKMAQWKVVLLSLWKLRVLRRFLDKMQQMSAGSWV